MGFESGVGHPGEEEAANMARDRRITEKIKGISLNYGERRLEDEIKQQAEQEIEMGQEGQSVVTSGDVEKDERGYERLTAEGETRATERINALKLDQLLRGLFDNNDYNVFLAMALKSNSSNCIPKQSKICVKKMQI